MLRHIFIISLLLVSSNSFADDNAVINELKAKETKHKCDLVKRLNDKKDLSAEQKQELQRLQSEVKGSCN